MPKLEHDPELIERLARVYEGNARAHLKLATEQHEAARSGWSQHEMLAASGFVIAASYWSLIAPSKAVLCYRNAAAIYRPEGHSYWMVVALASASREEIEAMPSVIDETREPSPQTIAFAMIGNEISGTDRRNVRADRLSANWRHTGNPPIGRLGIPLDHYVRCAEAMRDARVEENRERFFFEAANYIHRAAEVLRSASHDSYHWRRLQSAILPAEPEAVAMTTAMSIMSHAIFRMPISEIPNLDRYGRLLVEIGDGMQEAARRGEERRR